MHVSDLDYPWPLYCGPQPLALMLLCIVGGAPSLPAFSRSNNRTECSMKDQSDVSYCITIAAYYSSSACLCAIKFFIDAYCDEASVLVALSSFLPEMSEREIGLVSVALSARALSLVIGSEFVVRI